VAWELRYEKCWELGSRTYGVRKATTIGRTLGMPLGMRHRSHLQVSGLGIVCVKDYRREETAMKTWQRIVIGSGAGAALAGTGYLLFRRRRQMKRRTSK
jgi:hypothetical protein